MAKRAVKKAPAKRRPSSAVPKTARAMLNLIDRFFVRGKMSRFGYRGDHPPFAFEEARKLWDVLSALRGPDQECSSVKDRTTVPIRDAAFPRTRMIECHSLSHVITGAGDRAAFGTDDRIIDLTIPTGSTHFEYHARHAAEALGLEIR